MQNLRPAASASRMSRPKLAPLKMAKMEAVSEHPQTAPIMEETILDLCEFEVDDTKPHGRTYSLSQATTPQRYGSDIGSNLVVVGAKVLCWGKGLRVCLKH
jgi:hypothetical protein